MTLYALAVIVHIIGSAVGVGAVTINDLQYCRAIGDKDLGVGFQKSAEFYGKLIKGGLALLVISGLYFMFSKPVLWGSEKILTKLALVAILIINGLIINFVFQPMLLKLKAEDWSNKSEKLKVMFRKRLPFDIVSIVSWYVVLVLGAAGRQSWNAIQISATYLVVMTISYFIGRAILNKRLGINNN